MSLQVDYAFPKEVSTSLNDYDQLEVDFLKEEIFISAATGG